MNNEIDLLDELEREERDERLAQGGGGVGAALGVVLTFVIGCGLVFSAYKLGQRKTVDEPPLIAASDVPIRTAPADAGGAEIPNTGNLANAMIDGSRPTAEDFALSDGVVVEANLPRRDFDQIASSAETREIRREVEQLNDLPLKTGIDGEPSLGLDGPPDRTDEQRMTADAEVPGTGGPTLDELVAAASAEEAAEIAAIDAGAGAVPPALELSVAETIIAPSAPSAPSAASDDDARSEGDGTQIAMRMPMAKPNLGPSAVRRTAAPQPEPATPALAPETRPTPPQVRQRVEPAIARVGPTLAPPVNPLAQPVPQLLPNPGIERVRVPPQPLGDAQVQLGAFGSPNEVRGRWAALKGRNPDLLGQLGLKVMPVQTADGRQLYRMRVGPLRDTLRAAQLCQALAGRGIDCSVPQRQ